jgi:hypothetical protein
MGHEVLETARELSHCCGWNPEALVIRVRVKAKTVYGYGSDRVATVFPYSRVTEIYGMQLWRIAFHILQGVMSRWSEQEHC